MVACVARICYEELQVVADQLPENLSCVAQQGECRLTHYTGLSSQGGRGCPLSGLWPFVGRYTSCSAPYPLAGGRDGHEGPPQGGGSEPDAAAALLGLRLARDKDVPCAGEGTAYTEHAAL